MTPFKEALEKAFREVKASFYTQDWDSNGEPYVFVDKEAIVLWGAKFALEFAEKEAKCRTFDALTSGELRQLREGL